MKKIFIYISLLVFLFVATSCNGGGNKNKEYNKLKVLSINDLHGAIDQNDDNYGMSGISWYVNEQRKVEGQAVLVLAAGDMFQGSAISNYYYGQTVVELMNDVKFDAMTIGNHEFDWGLEEVLKYVDGNEDNYEANFPFLACNLLEKETNELPDLIDPYTIVDFEQFQVGIIGYIGVGIETDISASKVEDYYFADPVSYISNISKDLRENKGCDLIIVMGHDDNSATQNQIAALSGSSSVDMIIAGHTHVTYTRYLTNGNGVEIPLTQAGTAADALTDTSFLYNKEDNTFGEGYADTVDLCDYEIGIDEAIQNKVDQMNDKIEPVMGEVLGIASKNVNRSSVGNWTADAILASIDCDIAAINSGGIRSSAFPINEGYSVTVKKIYEVMPFDNFIKVCDLTGSQLINIFKRIQDIHISSNLVIDGNSYYLNGALIENDKVYRFACVDYLYDRDAEIYECGTNVEFTGILVRDIMINTLKLETSNGKKWLED